MPDKLSHIFANRQGVGFKGQGHTRNILPVWSDLRAKLVNSVVAPLSVCRLPVEGSLVIDCNYIVFLTIFLLEVYVYMYAI